MQNDTTEYCVEHAWAFILVFEVAGLLFKTEAQAGLMIIYLGKTKICFQRMPNFILWRVGWGSKYVFVITLW
jgi:hypothetical protein